MAKVIRRVERAHPCHTELAELDTRALECGSVAECSCGRLYTLRENQRDGMYWHPIERREHT